MWPFDQLSGFVDRLTRPKLPEIIVDDHGFYLSKSRAVLADVPWSTVQKVVAFKRDRGCSDEICLDIWVQDRPEVVEVSEEFGGYGEFTKALEGHLPGINHQWWSQVAFPAFVANPTLVFERRGGELVARE